MCTKSHTQMLPSSPWSYSSISQPYSSISHVLGPILDFLEKSFAAFDTGCAVEQVLQYVDLPQGCVLFTAEPRTHSPMSQFLSLN